MQNEITLLTPLAAARMLECSEHTIKHYAVTGKLPALVTTTGRRLFRLTDLEEFKRAKAAPAPEAA